jgi:SAM-dependent methyltransferase
LNATGYDQSYYDEHKKAGLDYLGFGEWQQQYGRWLVETLGYKNRRMLDVGCACGSILRGLGQAGAIVQGVDLCEPMIQLGREKWPDMAPLLFVCDAVNLHLFADNAWDGLHSAQVAEHWKPELVPFILRELARITVTGGLFFCALDTEELFARQGRSIEYEDPTHVCIKPMSWWHDQLSKNGWEVCTNEWEPALRAHPEDFLTRYDWDWFVARRKAQ